LLCSLLGGVWTGEPRIASSAAREMSRRRLFNGTVGIAPSATSSYIFEREIPRTTAASATVNV